MWCFKRFYVKVIKFAQNLFNITSLIKGKTKFRFCSLWPPIIKSASPRSFILNLGFRKSLVGFITFMLVPNISISSTYKHVMTTPAHRIQSTHVNKIYYLQKHMIRVFSQTCHTTILVLVLDHIKIALVYIPYILVQGLSFP